MKKSLLITFVGLTLFPLSLLASEDYVACYETARTQEEMASCATKELKAAEAELHQVYQHVHKLYQHDPIFLSKLDATHKAWLQFRDAQLALKYPHQDKGQTYYGNSFSMCYTQTMMQLTQAAVVTLKQWETGTVEGDVCAGSMRIANAVPTDSTDLMSMHDKPTHGTITNLTLGDTGCYVDFIDTNGTEHSELAAFEICDLQGFIKHSVTFSYRQQNVMAAVCQGDPECPDTEKVWIIDQIR